VGCRIRRRTNAKQVETKSTARTRATASRDGFQAVGIGFGMGGGMEGAPEMKLVTESRSCDGGMRW
jgi:hypothetical protein